MPTVEQPKEPETTAPLGRIVDLARRVLRERGLTEAEVEALLNRPKAPDNLR